MVDITALPGTLDLFELLVNYIFGGILLSIIGWGAIILVTAIMGRLTMETIIVILGTYFGVAMAGYFGFIGYFPITLLAFYYAISGILNWWSATR